MNNRVANLIATLTLLALAAGCGSAPASDPVNTITIGPGQTLFNSGVSGGAPVVMPHTLAGFESCTSCHYIGTSGAIHLVNDAHVCDECHALSPMPPWDHGMAIDPACVICHQEAAASPE